MELELGLKFNRVVDDFSPTEFKIAKDRSGPIFLSRETDSLFILTAHLKGFTKQNVKIDINDDGTRIVIKGEKKVQETVLLGWKLYKKDPEIKAFKKIFKIPNGVFLDKITATFNEDESILTILMPKKVRGIRGMEIEEVKEEGVIEQAVKNVDDEKPRIDQTLLDKKQKAPEISTENEAESSGLKPLVDEDQQEEVNDDRQEEANDDRQEEANDDRQEEVNDDRQEEVNDDQEEKVDEDRKEEVNDDQQEKVDEDRKEEVNEDQHEQVNEDRKEEVNEDQQEKLNENRTEEVKEDRREDVNEDRTEEVNEDGVRPDENEIEHDEDDAIKQPEVAEESGDGKVVENPPEERCNKMCIPVIAGSALIVSFVVFVIQMIRSKHQDSKRKN